MRQDSELPGTTVNGYGVLVIASFVMSMLAVCLASAIYFFGHDEIRARKIVVVNRSGREVIHLTTDGRGSGLVFVCDSAGSQYLGISQIPGTHGMVSIVDSDGQPFVSIYGEADGGNVVLYGGLRESEMLPGSLNDRVRTPAVWLRGDVPPGGVAEFLDTNGVTRVRLGASQLGGALATYTADDQILICASADRDGEGVITVANSNGDGRVWIGVGAEDEGDVSLFVPKDNAMQSIAPATTNGSDVDVEGLQP